MDHQYIEDQDVAGRYMSGTLSLDERARFEEHFIDCPRCLDDLEHFDQLQVALRSVAAAKAAARDVPMDGVRQRRWWVHPAVRLVGAAAVVVIAITSFDAVRSRRELARVTALSEGLTRQNLDSENRLRDLSSQIQSLQRTEPAAGRQSSAPVFPLTSVRSAAAQAPANRVTLSGNPEWIVLLLDLTGAATTNRYRATLRTREGRQVWFDDQLRASTPEALGISLRAPLLTNGDYVLTVDALAPQSMSWIPVGRYDLRVASSR